MLVNIDISSRSHNRKMHPASLKHQKLYRDIPPTDLQSHTAPQQHIEPKEHIGPEIERVKPVQLFSIIQAEKKKPSANNNNNENNQEEAAKDFFFSFYNHVHQLSWERLSLSTQMSGVPP